MARKLVNQLQAGMVLSEDLVDAAGSLLLPARTALSPQHLRMLKYRSIPVVHVQGEEEEALAWQKADLHDLLPEMHRKNEQHLNDLFRNTNREEAFTARLYYYLLDRKNRQSVLAESKNAPA